ncbi:MAG: hypothetical protein J6L85_01680 [Clostridia bacterium]|nr:hypothetical protein [Clostridia bacterium]
MSKSIELLKICENLCVMALLTDDTNLDISRLSLFERFAFLCNALDRLVGNRLRNEFLAALSDDFGCDISAAALKDKEFQKRLWRILCDPFEKPFTDIAHNSVDNSCEAVLEEREFINKIVLTEYIINADEKKLENVFDAICDMQADFLCVDATAFRYTQPDAYHCEIIYEKMKCGEENSCDDVSMLLAWSLCRVLTRRNFNVLIKANGNITEISKLIELFDRRKLFPLIYLCIDRIDVIDVKMLADLCLNAKGRNVHIVISKGCARDTDFLKKLTYFLPFCRISVSK